MVIFAVLMFSALAANADSQSGKIVGFVPYTKGGKEVFLFKFQGNNTGGCNSSGRFAMDSTSLHFKATYAAILAAFNSQSDVFVAYSQSCNAWSNAWDVTYVCTGAINC